MSTHRRAADDISPMPAAVVLPENAPDNASGPGVDVSASAVQPRARGPRRAIRNAVVVGCAGVASGSAGWVFGGPVLAACGILAVIGAGMLGVVAVVVLSAMLGSRDPRSPFERLMLILCVILGRSPGTYLPPAQDGQDAARVCSRRERPISLWPVLEV